MTGILRTQTHTSRVSVTITDEDVRAHVQSTNGHEVILSLTAHSSESAEDADERLLALVARLAERAGLSNLQTLRTSELEDALLYACGYDVAGWPGHLRDEEILKRAGVDPAARRLADAGKLRPGIPFDPEKVKVADGYRG